MSAWRSVAQTRAAAPDARRNSRYRDRVATGEDTELRIGALAGWFCFALRCVAYSAL